MRKHHSLFSQELCIKNRNPMNQIAWAWSSLESFLQKRKKKMSEYFAGFKKSCTFAPLFRGMAFQAPLLRCKIY